MTEVRHHALGSSSLRICREGDSLTKIESDTGQIVKVRHLAPLPLAGHITLGIKSSVG